MASAQLRNLRSGAVLTVSPDIQEQAATGLTTIQLDPAQPTVALGTPVELTLASHLLLAEVIESRPGQILLRVEHMLDRTAVTALQEVWRSLSQT